jgi:hypothetical protein
MHPYQSIYSYQSTQPYQNTYAYQSAHPYQSIHPYQSTHPYPSMLLNELHRTFPQLLYQPERFQSVQDVLAYMRDVANDNIFIRERNNYLCLQQQNSTPLRNTSSHSIPSHSIPSHSTSSHSTPIHNTPLHNTLVQPVPHLSSMRSRNTTHMTSNDYTPRIYLRERSAITPSVSYHIQENSSLLSDNLINALITTLFNEPSDENTIHVTEQHITENTSEFSADGTIDDNCAICLERMTDGQHLRKINACAHTFHKECIDRVFTSSSRCPICRHSIV